MPPPLALYVHIPWCVRKCPYCDFNSHQAKGELPIAEYVQALITDLDQDLPLVWGRTISSVFFGGGTPSLFPGAAIADILSAASARLRFAPECEITLECNPGTAEFDRFEHYRQAGVNRLSFGVQSFNDEHLHVLGRIHSSNQAARAVRMAQDAGFANINLDLMYALPKQTTEQALDDLNKALALEPAHLSHYHLTLEPNTLYAARPPAGLPDEDQAWETQERCQEMLRASGFSHYEVSAYARSGRYCQHNLNYWQFGDYLGIGAGAHGKITSGADQSIRRRWKLKNPGAYLKAATSNERIGGDELIAPENRAFEFMLNALRLQNGFDLNLFIQRTGLPLSSLKAQLDSARQREWIVIDEFDLKITEQGQRFNNDLISLFLQGN